MKKRRNINNLEQGLITDLQVFERVPNFIDVGKSSSSPVTGLEWPRGLQEVKVPRFHDNGKEWW
jgi:hypothetical protein